MSDESGNPLPRATFRELAGRAVVAAGNLRSDSADQEWVRAILTPAELPLWTRQSAYDQDHSLQVARRVEHRLAATAYRGDPLWLGAALMHDVGKPSLSMGERALATLASKVVKVETARRWARTAAGAKRRLGAYLIHGEIGAAMIRTAGGREEVAAWTELHQGYRSWDELGLPPVVVEALVKSDVA